MCIYFTNYSSSYYQSIEKSRVRWEAHIPESRAVVIDEDNEAVNQSYLSILS